MFNKEPATSDAILAEEIRHRREAVGDDEGGGGGVGEIGRRVALVRNI